MMYSNVHDPSSLYNGKLEIPYRLTAVSLNSLSQPQSPPPAYVTASMVDPNYFITNFIPPYIAPAPTTIYYPHEPIYAPDYYQQAPAHKALQAKLENTITQLQIEVQSIHIQHTEAENQWKSNNTKLQEVQVQLENTITQLQIEIQSITTQHTEAENQWKSNNTQLQEEVKRWKSQYEIATRKTQEIQNKSEEIQHGMRSQMEQEVDKLVQQQKQKLNHKHQLLIQDLTSANEKEMKIAQKKLDSAQSENGRLNKQLQLKVSEIKQLNTQLADLQRKLDCSAKKLQFKCDELEQKENVVRHLSVKCEQVEDKLHEQQHYRLNLLLDVKRHRTLFRSLDQQCSVILYKYNALLKHKPMIDAEKDEKEEKDRKEDKPLADKSNNDWVARELFNSFLAEQPRQAEQENILYKQSSYHKMDQEQLKLALEQKSPEDIKIEFLHLLFNQRTSEDLVLRLHKQLRLEFQTHFEDLTAIILYL